MAKTAQKQRERAGPRQWPGTQRSRIAPPRLGMALVVGLCVLEMGCRRTQSEPTSSNEWARGDLVVVEALAGEFYEARVVGVEGDQLRVQRTQNGASTTLSVNEVYRLPSRGLITADQLVVCSPRESHWIPCRTTSVSADRVSLVTVDGQRFSAPNERVVVPGKLTSLNLERRFADANRRARFHDAASRAGRPLISANWSPSPRESVIVERADGWFSATVHELDKDRVHVKWDANGRITEVLRRQLAPEGPYAIDPEVGAFVLTRPQSPAEPWRASRVTGTVEEHGVVVENAGGERQTRPLRDVVPLGLVRPK